MREASVTMTGHRKMYQRVFKTYNLKQISKETEKHKLRIKTCKRGQVWSDKTCENLEQVRKHDQVR